VLLHHPSERRFRLCAGQLRKLGAVFDEGLLRKAYFATRVIPRKQYDCILRLLIVLPSTVEPHEPTRSPRLWAELPVVTLARTFIKEHHTEELSLTVVARAVHMSPFYFCKVFRRETGLTFTDYLARMPRREREDPTPRPAHVHREAAFACGFQSLSQFNRVFRRFAGQAPSAFRMR